MNALKTASLEVNSDAWLDALIALSSDALIALVPFFVAITAAAFAYDQWRRSERQKVRLNLYREISALLADAGSKSSRYAAFLRVIQSNLERKYPWFAGDSDFHHFQKLQQECHESIIDLLLHIERWEVVDRRWKIFRFALIVANDDLAKAEQSYFYEAMQTFPIPIIGRNAAEISSAEIVGQLKKGIDLSLEAEANLDAWLSDISIGLQNCLVGSLFGNRLPDRSPPDPNSIVLSLGSHEETLKRLESETNFGRYAEDLISRTEEEFRKRT